MRGIAGVQAKDGDYEWVHVRIGSHPDRSASQGQVAGPALPALVGTWKIVSYEDRDAADVVGTLTASPRPAF